MTQSEMPAWWDAFLESLPFSEMPTRTEVTQLARQAMAWQSSQLDWNTGIDTLMLDGFHGAMSGKMAQAREKGLGGWDGEECSITHLWGLLRGHTLKENQDFRDVGAFAGMIWYRLTHGVKHQEDRAELALHLKHMRAHVLIPRSEVSDVERLLAQVTGSHRPDLTFGEFVSKALSHAEKGRAPLPDVPETVPYGSHEHRAYDRLLQVDTYAENVRAWLFECFGPEVAIDPTERAFRFFEEAAELCQSMGVTEVEALQLLGYVYERPVGEMGQEIGGVMVTLAALCSVTGMSIDILGGHELRRVWSKKEKIRAKHAAKPEGVRSALPGRVDDGA